MEEHYMTKIWHIIGAKENQGLTPKEMQDRITDTLCDMRIEVQKNYKTHLKTAIKNAFNSSLDLI